MPVTEMNDALYREEVRPTDADEVRKVVESTGFFSPAEIEIAVELVEERLSRGDKSGYHFVIRDGPDGVVGYTCYGPIAGTESSYDLYWIAVREDCRGRGLGRGLMERSEVVIAGRGGTRVYVETSSRAQYEPTRKFYESCGYVREAFLKDFYAKDDSKIIYVKELKRC